MTAGSSMAATVPSDAIAVIGMAGRLPGAATLHEYWEVLRAGRDCSVPLTDEELIDQGVDPQVLANPAYVKRAIPLDGFDEFDPGFFGLSPREARLMDPQQRLFLECCWHAFEDAGCDPARLNGAVGVFATCSASVYFHYHLLSHIDAGKALGSGLGMDLVEHVAGADPNFIASRVAFHLDLRGPAIGVQTACSSALVATHLACQSLLNGECDLALAGGMSIQIPNRMGYMHEPGSLLSPDGRCRPFDAGANGTVVGSGGGAVLLKPLDRAIEDGDHIRAVIRGSAVNNDGALKMGFTAPSVDAYAEVVAEAMEVARVDPATISYVEAHGTGTSLGDPVEIAALTKAFGPAGRRRGRVCRIGSVKGNIGHLEHASGVAGLLKLVLALEHRQLPPTVHHVAGNPELGLAEGAFRIQDCLEPWPGPAPRRAGISAIGMGGTNAHIVLEQAPAAAEAPDEPGPWVLRMSAMTPAALGAQGDLLAEVLSRPDAPHMADVARTLIEGRRSFNHRRVVVARSAAEAASRLKDPAHRLSYVDSAAGDRPAVALLFPGEGAECAGMTAGLYAADPPYRADVDRCVALFGEWLTEDLLAAMFGGDDQRLRRTDLAQAALFTVEYALARRICMEGVEPTALAGYGIGEYPAACLAGVLDLPGAVRLVAARGIAMRAAPAGGQSAAMAEVAEQFAAEAARVPFAPPRIPLASSVTGTWLTDAEAVDPARWSLQIRACARFSGSLAALLAEPERVLVEAGPGRTLTGLACSHPAYGARHRVVPVLPDSREPRTDHESFLLSIGRMWAAGAEIRWPAPGTAGRRVPLPGYPFDRRRYWVEPSYAR